MTDLDLHSPFSLVGKTALITGAGQGIGRAATEAFCEAGARVIAVDKNYNALQKLPEHKSVLRRKVDITLTSEIEKIALEFSSIDILFNCAGFVAAGSILACNEDDWDFTFDLNVKAVYRLTRALLPRMIAAGGGSIINMSSVASSLKGVPNRFVYSASKAAVIGITKAIAADHIKDGIRCNAICPGTVESPSLKDRLRATGDFERARRDFVDRQPMGRIGKPHEIAALALYLASDASAFTTGQTHLIDGGWSL